MAQKSISPGTLKTNFGVNNLLIFAQEVSTESLWTGQRHSTLVWMAY